MVTASHNENGWTGVKMGSRPPITFGPEEMGRLREIVLEARFDLRGGGDYVLVDGFRGALHRRPDGAAAPHPQDQGGGRLRQRHRRRLRAAGDRGARRRRGAARHRARLQFPALQSQPRRPRDAARHQQGGARQQGRHRPRLRRRRRPLRRHRQSGSRDLRRQGRRHARARPLGAPPEQHLRRRREIDRPVPDRSGARQERRQDGLLEDRAFLHQAPRQRAVGDRRLREVGPLFLQSADRPRL